ncbi:MAG TPA: hypothetical protein VGW38_28760, partial [Chloroflexota bacterium]|nr:hypothetical protein [Chloroflexota bacterium]
MQELSGFPYFEVQFTKHGTVHDEREVAEVRDCLAQQPVTDLFVIAHGWNNDLNDARGLFRAFFARVREVVDSGLVPGVSTRRFAVLGVLWPSKKFAERDLIPSGAATAQSPVSDEALREQLEEIKGTFDAPDADVKLEQAKRLIRDLDDSKRARQEFVDLLRGLLPPEAADEEDASDRFFALPEEEVMQRLSRPVLPSGGAMTSGAGGAASMGSVGTLSRPPAGGAARLGQFFAGVKSAARNLINYVTYYEMKERAGTVGRDGVAPVLHAIRALRPDLKIHLIGHSFG